jgi:hypothetical protein
VYRNPPSDKKTRINAQGQNTLTLTSSGSIPAQTMREDYKQGLVEHYASRSDTSRSWGILGHFTTWEMTDDLNPRDARGHATEASCGPMGWSGTQWTSECGASYWNVFADTIAWAASGCPTGVVGSSTLQCPDVKLVSYREMLPELDAAAKQK